MCYLCEENDGEMEGCQDCGRMICFDNDIDHVDVLDRAYVTEGGDLFCHRCGIRYDRAAEKWDDDEEEVDYYEDW